MESTVVNKTILCWGLSVTFIITAFVASKALAGDKLVFGTDIRLRYEFQDNFNQKYYGDNPKQGASDDGFLLGRFRAGLDYRPCETIHLTVWMQHSEVWDMALPDSAFYNQKLEREHNPNKDPWELSDTYLEVKRPFELPLVFKGGRQRIIYGNKRIFGPGQWGNTGRWIWDAVSLSYPFNRGFVDVYYGRTVIHDPDEFSLTHRHFYESLGSYGHFALPQYLLGFVFEPFMMTKRDNHNVYTAEDGITKDLDAYYAGIRVFRDDLRGLDVDMTYLREFGDYSHDALEAYAYHILFAYQFKSLRIRPRVSVEYSVASGDSDPADGDRGTFDGAFGARDKMYGRMNLFHWMNIKDAQVNLEGNPGRWCYFKLGFHQFWLAEEKDAWYLNAKEYRDKTGESGHAVGKELDMVVKVDLPRKNEIQLGFGHFWPDEFAKNQAANKQASWVFLQWEYQFSWALL